MAEAEATQDPTAPEGAPASPPTDLAINAATETAAPPLPEAEAAPAQATFTEPALAEQALAPEAPSEAALAEEAGAAPPVDWAHLRGLQSVEPPAEALAVRSDYAEELGKELAARAARFGRSVDESIVLSSDGLMRWLGDPVARVVAGDELLQPRGVLLADEALAGEDRVAAETRVALWLAAHVRKVLGPLLALGEGGELAEAARALGGKIAEALGVLDRERVRNDVRALDQTARGALRKLGVRFGSLYIYVPALLKPGARSLCSLLWTLRRGTEPGADRLLAFASAGRTSFANEGLLSPDAYRVAGFRLCGERVVRVDIIERLSDLIRAAMPDHMRSGSRPASEAYGFLISPQMTSLTGCSGEAFASILRSLGFEPVKVSKAAFEAANAKAPTEPIKPQAAEATPEGETASLAEAAPEAAAEANAALESEATQAVADASLESEASQAEAAPEAGPESEAPQVVAEGETASLAEAAPKAALDEQANSSAPEVEAASNGVVEVDAAPNEEGAPEAVEGREVTATEESAEAAAEAASPAADEHEKIEIWRPAPRRPRAPRHEPSVEHEARPHRGKPQRRERPPASEAAAPEARPQAPHRAPRAERRDDGPRRYEGKGDGREDRRPHKDFGSRREQRPVQVDPDSPFAKLAALKPLLERRDKRP
ncbi:MAG TPA: hypothetical protein VN715_00345 [Roseiarcus sp.]|nr:hypothetical protein [Roseiarcus sp.]